ncbi:hypothetical protein ACFLZN_01405 [Nanoarchaeota archaeon]
MLDNKKIQQIKNQVQRYLRDGLIKMEKQKQFIPFFLNNAKNSLDTARLLFKVTNDEKLRDDLGFPELDSYLWVINSSYYSMFYITRALLTSRGIAIKTSQSIHVITYHALVHYFYATEKLQKQLVDDFEDAGSEASVLLGQEKAKQLVIELYREKEKRSTFTYELGVSAMKSKARTSLERATRYNEELRKILETR